MGASLAGYLSMLRILGLLLLTAPVVCQGFETEMFSVEFPSQPRVERAPIGSPGTVSYQVESGEPLVSYLVTITPFLEKAKTLSTQWFLESELSMFDGEILYSTRQFQTAIGEPKIVSL